MRMDTDGDIHMRAYAIWEAEGRPDGRSLDHWLRAEAEARPRRAPARARARASIQVAKTAGKAPSSRRSRAKA